jgi:hypothetical protein
MSRVNQNNVAEAKAAETIVQMMESLGINKEQLQKLVEQSNWADFAEKYFKAPPDAGGKRNIEDDEKLQLDPWQRKVIDKVEFRYQNPEKCKPYLLIVAPRGLGKSVVVGVINAILMIIGPNTTSIFSPSERQSETLLSKSKYFIYNSQFKKLVLKRGKSIPGMQTIKTGSLTVGTTKGSYSVANSNNEETMRGGHFSAVLVDEYARMTSHTVKAGILPMVRRSKGPIIAITTPFGRYGPAWEAFNDKKNWDVMKVSATEASWITKESLEQEAAAYGQDVALAQQELYAEFVSDDQAVFKDYMFEHIYDSDFRNMAPYQRQYSYHMSIDVGWDSNRAVFMVGHLDGKANVAVDAVVSMLNPTPSDLQNMAIRLIKRYNIIFILPDGKSVGVEFLRRLYIRIRKERIRCKIFTQKEGDFDKFGIQTQGGAGRFSKTNLVQETVELIDRHKVRIPSHEKVDGDEPYELEKEMRAFAYDKSPQGHTIKFGRGVNKEADDRVLGLLYLVFSFPMFNKKKKSDATPGASAVRKHPMDQQKFKSMGSSSISGMSRGLSNYVQRRYSTGSGEAIRGNPEKREKQRSRKKKWGT